MAQHSPYNTDSRRWWRSRTTVGVLLIFLFPLLLMALGWSLRGLPGLPRPQTRPGKLPVAYWGQRAGLGTPRDDFGTAVVGGRIWVLGGMTGARGNRLDSVEVYDPATDTWADGPRLTAARSSFRAVAIGTTIYAFGGAAARTAAIDTAEALDTTTGQWRSLPPLPTPRFGHAVVELNGLIYVIGGYSGGKGISLVHTFDPQTNEWRAVDPLPTPRYNLAAVALGGKIYAFGGWKDDAPSTTMEIFDPATGRWSAGPPLPVAMSNFGATALAGRIYALRYTDSQVFDPRANRWIAAMEMPTPRSGQGVATVGEALFAIGGCYQDPQYDVNTVEAYTLGIEEEPDNFRWLGYDPPGAAALIFGLLFTAVLMTTMLRLGRNRPRHNRDEPEGGEG